MRLPRTPRFRYVGHSTLLRSTSLPLSEPRIYTVYFQFPEHLPSSFRIVQYRRSPLPHHNDNFIPTCVIICSVPIDGTKFVPHLKVLLKLYYSMSHSSRFPFSIVHALPCITYFTTIVICYQLGTGMRSAGSCVQRVWPAGRPSSVNVSGNCIISICVGSPSGSQKTA
ncbi:hypothetical protein CPB83DRAFT_638901 [Crepidotus variabilis]|uniref:Uncharacterized protein n=1 Tax=Crepidotus variabilis TaxID=179855 RepID=A0A9P6E7X1_9AGAR|nr:hypothetical protein CPB83DRAFT_638901 [Crepidotus variabilis]